MVPEKAGFYATGVADPWLFLLTQDCRFCKKTEEKKIEKMFISFCHESFYVFFFIWNSWLTVFSGWKNRTMIVRVKNRCSDK